MLEGKNLARFLDLANHNANSTKADIKKICESSRRCGFHSVFVNPFYVAEAKNYLSEGRLPADVKAPVVGTVVSFPLGQETTAGKVESALEAVGQGASELDVSSNVGLLKDGREEEFLSEMRKIVENVRRLGKGTMIKFIIETGYLSDGEIKKAARLVLGSGADFVKTCSGMGPRGATVRDVELIREAVGSKIKVKVAGGVTTYEQAKAFIEAGADRIGTSHAVEIVEGRETEKGEGE